MIFSDWENGPISQMPSKNEYVPMFWGSKKWDDWNDRKAEMEMKAPEHLLGFNEPDITTQPDMKPSDAADLWMQEIQPWAANGTKLISPAVAWDLNWTETFLTELESRDGYVDFVAVHLVVSLFAPNLFNLSGARHGSYSNIAGFKDFVINAQSRFGYNIWVTEVGITTASGATEQQTRDFMMQAFKWMDSTGYVDRAAWFGCFETSSPPDGFATAQNALFDTAA